MATIINCGGGTVTSCPFPVGFGGFFQTDPSTIYSGTTWAQKKDVFILAAGTAYPAGSTGGEATHKLTVEEMPNHHHPIPFAGGSETGFGVTINNGNISPSGWGSRDAGGSRPHNNMPPYFSMPFWIRTA